MQKNQPLEKDAVAQKRPAQFYVDRNEDSFVESRLMDNRPFDRDDRPSDMKGDGNKIRRGPGRRIAKEKRMRNMDPALLQKYASLPDSLQEKVNATIQICYQQYMSNVYKNSGKPDQSHYDTDIVIDNDDEALEVQTEFDR